MVVFMHLGRPAARQSHFALPALWSTRYSGSTRLATTVFQSGLARLADYLCLCVPACLCACVPVPACSHSSVSRSPHPCRPTLPQPEVLLSNLAAVPCNVASVWHNAAVRSRAETAPFCPIYRDGRTSLPPPAGPGSPPLTNKHKNN